MRLRLDTSNRYQLERYSPETSEFSIYLQIGKWLTDPQFTKSNACQIYPIDRIIYCIMSGPSRNPYIMNIVRLDRDKVSFIAKVAGQAYAATIDTDGVYIWDRSPGQPAAAGTMLGKELFYLPEIHKMRGFDTSNDSPVTLYAAAQPRPTCTSFNSNTLGTTRLCTLKAREV
jgi:hypothetical protein